MRSLFLVRGGIWFSLHSFVEKYRMEVMFYLYLYYIPIMSWILVAVLSLHWHLASNVVTFGSKFTSFKFVSPSQLCLLAGPSLGSPVSVPAASPEAQPVADPEADAHYGHYGDKIHLHLHARHFKSYLI